MAERAQALVDLERILEAIRLGHEIIYGFHRDLISAGLAGDSAELVRESAQITLQRAPETSAGARLLARGLSEESVLDPERAALTVARLTAEVRRIEPELRSMLTRQVEIARELRGRLASGGP